MSGYDFSTLNGVEFEELVNDLLSRELKIRIERFREGKDQGVDGRYFTNKDEEIIIQSKHYFKSGFNSMKSTCKNEEKNKVGKLNPKRYIFACSIELSKREKDEIYDIFKPYLKKNDIYDGTKINDLIKDYKDIEFNHYKLWLSSSNILNELINSDINFDCSSEYKSIIELSKKYVKTNLHEEAKKIIEKNKFLLILGQPGAGKTSLARMICNEYIRDGYEFVYICDNIKNAKRKYGPKKKQVFYLDDFLGNNHLTEFSDNKDRIIDDFINTVTSDNNKRVVLSSRTVIFNQAHAISEALERSQLELGTITIDANNISTLDKARILYNHLYFAIDPKNEYHKHISEILEKDRYLNIIQHDNYNPRLIELMFGIKTLQKHSPEEYWNYIKSSLDNPDKVWEKHVRYQMGNEDRVLLWLVSLTKGTGIPKKELRKIYLSLRNKKNDPYIFNHTIRCLEGALLESVVRLGEERVRLHNNSIRDYVIPMLLNSNVEYTAEMIVALGKHFSLSTIPFDSSRTDAKELWSNVIKEISIKNKNIDLFVILINAIFRTGFIDNRDFTLSYNDDRFIKKEIERSRKYFCSYIKWCNEENLDSKCIDVSSVILTLKISSALDILDSVSWRAFIYSTFNGYLDHDDLVQLSKLTNELMDNLNNDHELHEYVDEIEEKIVNESRDYWSGQIEEHLDSYFNEDILVDECDGLFDEYESFEELIEENDEDYLLEYVESHIKDLISSIENEYYYITIDLQDDLESHIDFDEYNQKAIDEFRAAFEEFKSPKEKNSKTTYKKRLMFNFNQNKNNTKTDVYKSVKDIFK